MQNNKQILLEKFKYLFNYLLKQKIDINGALSFSKKKKQKVFSGEDAPSKSEIKKLVSYFINVKLKDMFDDSIELPSLEELKIEQKTFKLNYLEKFLFETKQVHLYRAISIREDKMEDYLKGSKMPSSRILTLIANYFFLSFETLHDDEIELPEYEKLQVDEDLCSIQRDDYENKLQYYKNKNYISRSYRVLSYTKRIKLFISLAVVLIPLLAYTLYCSFLIINERMDTVDKYSKESDVSQIYNTYDADQVKYYENLELTSKKNNPDAFYCDVTVGTRLYRIFDISPASSSFKTTMELYYIFDKEEYKEMFKHYAKNMLLDQVINDWNEENPEDIKTPSESMTDWLNNHQEFFELWVDKNDSKYYPGETPSNVLTDKNTIFDIGNGSFVADSYGTVVDLEEFETKDENGKIHTTCYQKVKFDAQFNKAFDSYRYPLESLQFKMYIQPTLDSSYIRYIPDRSVNEYGEAVSGFSPYFKISGGYRPVKESEDISNFSVRLNYYVDTNNNPAIPYEHTYRTQLEIVVRANRQGVSLFLQAFINLFAVVIWISIAFYNQSHNNEDSIGMLGTGLFGAISSILVGLSMVSDAGIFSIITMINIFTLAIIMIMTYHAISAKRASVKNDKVMIAYNGIKLRIMFYLLLICTVVMFLIIPCSAYIFSL